MAASSTEKMYEELGLESVKSKDVGTEKCVFFYNVLTSESRSYVFDIIPDSNR